MMLFYKRIILRHIIYHVFWTIAVGRSSGGMAYSAYSDDPATSRAFAGFKADGSDHLKLLFCIDMLNEGIHVEDVSGVILFRPTVSPIIYKQQIGRALSASKAKEPVIFDIVNNIENLYSISTVEQEMQVAVNYYRFLGEGGMVVNERFCVIDELRDARKLFEQLNDTLSASWDTMYEYAKRFYAEHGNLEVPRRYKTADGYSLSAWLTTQRKVYAGIQYGVLGEDRIQKLEAIGMRWSSKFERSWERGLAEAKDYYNKHGDLNEPTMYVAPSGFKLGGWIADRREKGREKHSVERQRQLDALGMVWQKPDPWEVRYAAAKAYFIEHGDLNMPAQYKANGMWIAKWLNEQRQIYCGNRPGKSLTAEQVRRLEAIGMTWGKRSNYKKTRHAIESENSLYGHQAV